MDGSFDMAWISDILGHEFGQSIWNQFEQPDFPSISQFVVCGEGTKDPAFVLHCKEKTNIKDVAQSIHDLMKESNLGNPGTEEYIAEFKPGFIHIYTALLTGGNFLARQEATVAWTARLEEIRETITKRKVDNLRMDDRYPHEFVRKHLKKEKQMETDHA